MNLLIKNQEKAKEISQQWWGCGKQQQITAYESAMEALEWKEKQLIDRLEDWLANNICNAYNFRGDNISSTFINDCIKAMKGE